jgi:mRNA-binding protein PUF3
VRQRCKWLPDELTKPYAVSKHKFASNVVEKAIIHSSRNDKREIVKELIDMQPNGINKVAALLRDPIANFPVQVGSSLTAISPAMLMRFQTALTYAERPQRQEASSCPSLTYIYSLTRSQLFDIIYPLVLNIRHTPVGKRLEVKINEMESESFKPSLDKLVAASSHPLSSSISTNGTEASQIGSSSTRVTSPDRERGTLRASSSAPPSMKNKGDGAEDVVAASSADDQKLIDLLH